MTENDLCNVCNKNPRRNQGRKGVFADNCHVCDRREKQWNNTQKARKQKELERMMQKPQKCVVCSQEFYGSLHKKKECHQCFANRDIRKANELWAKRVAPTKPKQVNQEMIAYSFFRKKYSVPNNIYRG